MEGESGNMDTVNDIVWEANVVSYYDNELITDYYLKNNYGRKSRWQLWKLCIDIMKSLNIKTVFDIGAANGHFIYLCVKNGIDAYGIEPRQDEIDFANSKYLKPRLIKTKYQKVEIPNVDCVTILNFLHGKNHKKEDIELLLEKIFKNSRYLIASEPRWKELEMDNLLSKYPKIVSDLDWEDKHHLWKL